MATETTDLATFRRAARCFRPYRRPLCAVLVTTVVTTALAILPAFLIQSLVDDAIATARLDLVVQITVALLAIPAVTGLAGVAQVYYMARTGQRVVRDLRDQLHHVLLRRPLEFMLRTPAGEIQSRITNDVNAVEDVVVTTLRGTIVNLTIVVSVVISMFAMHALLAVISLALLPVFVLLAQKVGRTQRRIRESTQERLASLASISVESLSLGGLLITRLFGRQEYMEKRFRTQSEQVSRLGIRAQMTGRWFFMGTSLLFAWAPAVMYGVAGWLIISHRSLGVSLGTLLAFGALQARLFAPAGSMVQLLNIQIAVRGSLAVFQRIFEYLDAVDENDSEPAGVRAVAEVRRLTGTGLVFDDVAFAHDGAEEGEDGGLRIDHLDLTVRRGETLVVVGPSGSGKSTISYLACGLLVPQAGTVRLDGVDVHRLPTVERPRLVGMATQDAHLLNASIMENLLFARPDATTDEVREAVRTVGMHAKVTGFPDGYDTVVGERGFRLSSGERQRLALARVLIQDPAVLILDEATNALDAESQLEVRAAVATASSDRATLVVAHQVWTIAGAERIVFLRDGAIVEHGSHEELIAAGGLYARYASLQLATVATQH